MKHIALPLRVEQHHIQDGRGGIVISKIYQNSNTGATLPLCEIPWNEEFAEFIVQACNSHEKLVEALKAVLFIAKRSKVSAKGVNRVKSYEISPEVLTSVREALANATK